jgi:magnesium transporter
MIASFYGMNFVFIPGGKEPYGFIAVTVLALVITVITVLIFRKKKLF